MEEQDHGDPTIAQLVERITRWGESKGWDKPALCATRGEALAAGSTQPAGVDTNAVLAKIALVHTELSEAVEEARLGKYVEYEKDGKPEGVVVELADAVIRIFHLAGLLGLDLENAVLNKMQYNETREYRHGGKLA